MPSYSLSAGSSWRLGEARKGRKEGEREAAGGGGGKGEEEGEEEVGGRKKMKEGREKSQPCLLLCEECHRQREQPRCEL